MGSITLRFVSSTDLTSRIIRGGQMGFIYQHVEALVDDTLIGAHIQDGVQARPRNYDSGQFSQDLFVTLPCTDSQQIVFEAFLKAQIGKHYDVAALAELADGFLTGEAPNWPTSDTWICSALQTAALLTAGVIKGAPATVRLATPRDVLQQCAALVPIAG
jgi:hypothetical protein